MQLALDFETAEKLEAMQQARSERAAAGSFSGKSYVTTATSCSCPDWEHRCQAAGLQCKHQIALACRPAPTVERTHVGTVIRPKGDLFAKIFG